MKGETAKSIDFLKKFGNIRWVLTAIATDRKHIDTKTFNKDTADAAFRWIEQYNGDRNIYFTVNNVRADISIKPKKEHMQSAAWLHIDIDPVEGMDVAEEQERILALLTDKLPKGLEKPTFIVYSGGGMQGFWKIDPPIEVDGDVKKCEDFELYNKRLESIFGGDHTHNIDRIMRLPGTVNVPDAKKLKKGRVKALAKVLDYQPKNVYEIGKFRKMQGVQTSSSVMDGGNYGPKVEISGNVARIEDLSELDQWNVPDRVKVIIAQGEHPDQPKQGDNSRSAWVFDCVCRLVESGCPDEVVYSILTDPDWKISSSILEAKGGGHNYAVRQIQRAKEYSESPVLEEMNAKHAVIGNIGGKCRVLEEVFDTRLKRSEMTLSSFEDINNRYNNIKVKIGSTKEGADVLVGKGKYWKEHAQRRQYDYVRFMPDHDEKGVYNLWRGFSVEPKDGNCDQYLQHILENVCQGDEDNYEYIIRWMARVVQYPATSGAVAIVLRGGKGTGKGVFATTFGSLFGRHHMHIANAKHLVGQFNAHLRDCVSLFADEAFFARDKQHESVLKMLITEDSIPIEAKGIDVQLYPNYVHLIMASNDPHVIRATGDERRYFVLNMGEDKQQDATFFQGIHDQMENGGREALLYFLQNIDLKPYQVRDVPQTEALTQQKMLSMDGEESWWFEKLRDGRIFEHDQEWQQEIVCKRLDSDYTTYAERWKIYNRIDSTRLGAFLHRAFPDIKRFQKRVWIEFQDETGMTARTQKMAYHYRLGTLQQCRDAWDKVHGKNAWPDPIEAELDMQDDDVPF